MAWGIAGVGMLLLVSRGLAAGEDSDEAAAPVGTAHRSAQMAVLVADTWKEWCAAFPPSTFQGVAFYRVPPVPAAGGAGDEDCIATDTATRVSLLQGGSLDHRHSFQAAGTTSRLAEVAVDLAPGKRHLPAARAALPPLEAT